MRPVWLLESDAFAASMAPNLRREVQRQGMAFGILHYEMFASGYTTHVANRPLEECECVVFSGTWPLWRHIQLHRPDWIPGGWCSTENLDCCAYYPRFAGFLLNDRHVIMTGIEAIERREEIFERFSRDGRVFVRPTGCLKVFNGRCVNAADFAAALAPARYDPATRIVVAEPKIIGREWRLVVAEHEPIAVSQYYEAGVTAIARGCPAAVWAFAEQVLAEVAWEPDEIFILDVCESAGALRVMELNGFSCAGLYECDLAKVVATASELADRAWNNRRQPA
jgi:hypothetical protein